MATSYQVNLNVNPITVSVPQTVVGSMIAKAGVTPVPNGSDTITVTFATALANTQYAPQLTMMNLADSFPIFFSVQVVTFTINGFVAKLNAPTDTGNYSVAWAFFAKVNG